MLQVRGCQTLIDQALQTEGLIIPTSYKASEVFGRLRQVIVYKRRARLRWQSQPRQHGGLTRLRGNRAEKNYGQVSAGIEIDSSVIRH